MKYTKLYLLITILLLCCDFSILYAQRDPPDDWGNLELFVDKHKKSYNRLNERNCIQFLHKKLESDVKATTQKFQDFHKKITSQYGSIEQWIDLGVNSVEIIEILNDTRKELILFKNNIKRIHKSGIDWRIIKIFTDSLSDIKIDIKQGITLSQKIPLLRANAKELTKITSSIKEVLYQIISHLRIFNYEIEEYINLRFWGGGQREKIDRQEIVNSIIKTFKK